MSQSVSRLWMAAAAVCHMLHDDVHCKNFLCVCGALVPLRAQINRMKRENSEMSTRFYFGNDMRGYRAVNGLRASTLFSFYVIIKEYAEIT